MSYLGSWKIDDLLTFPANTHRFDTGNATDADSVPSYRVYEDETGTPILTGSMALLDSSNTAGFYSEQITLSAANGFEKGKCYTVYISATVNSITGTMSHTFQMEAEVDANRLNWANVDGPTTTVNLSGTTVKTATDVETDTQDIQSKIGTPAGASISADILVIDNFVDDLESRIGTPSDLGSGATIAANLVDIESQTDDIGVAGAGLSAIPWNASWDAEVQSEVDDALVAQNLDHLVKIAVDTDFATTVHLNSVIGHLADNGTTATFDRTTDSLEALQGQVESIDNFLDTEVSAILADTNELQTDWTNGGRLDLILDSIDSDAAAILADTGTDGVVVAAGSKTGYSLSSAGIQAIWDALTSALTTAGSIGKLLVDNVNATISSRSSHSAADVWAVATRLLTAGTNIVLAKGVGVTGFNDLSAAQVNTEVDTALADYDGPTHAELVSEINSVQADIAALNNLSAAQINAEVDTALADINLDHLVKIAVDTDFPTTVHLNSVIGHLADNGTLATFDRTTDSLEALQGQVETIDNFLDAEVAAILADTNELQTDWVDGGRLDLILDARASQTSVDTIDDFLDTEIAAIKAKTDQLTFTTATRVDASVIDKTGFELSSGERDSIATAFLKLDWTGITGEAQRSILNAFRLFRNRWTTSGGQLTVYKEDDVTEAWTAQVTSNPAADNLTEVDPD